MSLFTELKRRNVFRVAVAYLISAWVIAQVSSLVLTSIKAPDWVMQTLLLLLALGFIVALIISWAYEITPEGIKKEEDVKRNESISNQTAKKLDIVTLVAALLVVGLIGWQQVNPTTSAQAIPEAAIASESATTSVSEGVNNSNLVNHAATEKNTNNQSALVLGVAVLPFDNLSEDPNNAFFAGGVHEDVLTQLSYIKKLRVISRTSMMKVAERGMEVREIGSHLGVSHVLEGSVRRAGEQVRVTVQLIDALTDEHVWADNFDRKLDDIFAIQSEIAEQIAAQLKAELTPDEIQLIEQAPTTSNEAYDLYIKARELRRVWRGADTFKDMLPLLEKAVALDPEFLKAQVMLTEVYGRLVWTGSDPTGEYKVKAQETLNAILNKHPGSIEAANARSQYLYTVERDYAGSLQAINEVLREFPNDSEALLRAASSYKRLGNFTQGLPLMQKAASLDPEHAAIALELTLHLLGAGRTEQAYQNDQINLIKFPNDAAIKTSLADTELVRFGNIDRFNELLQQLSAAERFDSGLLTYEINVTPENVDETVALIDQFKQTENIFNAAFSDRDVAILFNAVGREQASQQRAKSALAYFENNQAALENFAEFRQKEFNAAMTHLSCLANDQPAFERYEAIMHSHKGYEIKEGLVNYARAIAECGDIPRAWAMLYKEANSQGLTVVTPWLMALNPTYQHYFSELPEYQKMVADLYASREERP